MTPPGHGFLSVDRRSNKGGVRQQAWVVGAMDLALSQSAVQFDPLRVNRPVRRRTADITGIQHGRFPALQKEDVSVSVWFRANQRIEQDVQVANHWQDESVVNTETIGDEALQHRDDGAPDDCHIQNPRANSGQRAEFCHAQAEDRGKHDRIEQADGEHAPHRGVPLHNH